MRAPQSIVPLFEVTHFGIQAGVAHLEFAVGFLLLLQLPVNVPYPQPAAFAQPQRVLQQGNDYQQGDSQPTHGRGRRRSVNQERL